MTVITESNFFVSLLVLLVINCFFLFCRIPIVCSYSVRAGDYGCDSGVEKYSSTTRDFCY